MINSTTRKLFVGGVGTFLAAISATAFVLLAFSGLFACGMAHDFSSDRWRILYVVLWFWSAMYIAWLNCGIAVRLGNGAGSTSLRKFALLSAIAIATCPFLWDAGALSPS